MSDTVKQSHLVPKCYLKNFASDNEIVVFNKLRKNFLSIKIYQRLLNRLYDSNEEDTNYLSDIESILKTIFAKYGEPNKLQQSFKTHFSSKR